MCRQFLIHAGLALAGLVLSHPGMAQDDPVELVFGIRDDAAPFSFRIGETPPRDAGGSSLRDIGFDGYMVRVCDAALDELRRRPNVAVKLAIEPVTASNRFEALLPDAQQRYPETTPEVDILCDPATITPDRVRDRVASMPVYLSGISFLEIAPFPETRLCNAVVVAVRDTTTESKGIREILARGKWPRIRDDIIYSLENNGKVRPSDDPECGSARIEWLTSHDEALEWFCDRDAGDRMVLYYVGDLEIIRNRAARAVDCGHRIDRDTYTDERYAVFARLPRDDPRKAQVLLEFFAVLSELIYTDPDDRDSLLIRNFRDVFQNGPEGTQPSRRLQAFYWSLTRATWAEVR